MNEVTNFMLYMFNRWSIEECQTVFGDLKNHIWGKWCELHTNPLYFYGCLDTSCRQRLVDRANEIYRYGTFQVI